MPEQETQLPQADAERLERWLAIQPLLDEIVQEREARLEQWGDQSLPLGFGGTIFRRASDQLRWECDEANERGDVTHRHVLLEELYEALAEADPAKARDELIQVAACAVKAIQDIDRGATATKAAG